MPTPDLFEHTYDFRHLVAPEPMLRTLEAIDTLAPGAALRVLTPLRPYPLLRMLGECGLIATVEDLPDGGASVAIRRPA